MVDEKKVVSEALKDVDILTKVKNKTLHGKSVAKTPEDVLDNLMKDKE